MYLKYRTKGTYRMADACSGRIIIFTLNDEGDRGPISLTIPQSPGTLRIIAVGGSTTLKTQSGTITDG